MANFDNDGFALPKVEPEQLKVVEASDLPMDTAAGAVGGSPVDIAALTAEADRLEGLHDELRAKLVGNDSPNSAQ